MGEISWGFESPSPHHLLSINLAAPHLQMRIPMAFARVAVLACGLNLSVSASQIPTAKDVSAKPDVPTPKDAISLERLQKLASKEASASYSPDRVISPPMPIAIRQEHPGGPAYQEGLSYTFLIHSMKFAGMVRMDDGQLLLMGTGWLKDPVGEERGVFVMRSADEAQSWSRPRIIHWGLERPEPINLGGKKLVMIPRDDAGFISFSEDGGQHWGEKIPFPRLPDGSNRQTYRHGTPLVEGQTITGVFYTEGELREGWTAYSLLRRSRDGGRTWGDELWLPPEWLTSEGAITRARDGALVIALRTSQAPGLPSYSDHWRRITTARSMDEGKTWTDHQVHFQYGKVHSRLLTLSSGDILLTYAVRMGELDGEVYHGIEAVLSSDNGKTWDWDRRFILFRWAMHQSMHSPQSIELADGRILTLFGYHYDAKWNEGPLGAAGYPMGITSTVIWSPYPESE